jgi:hypothetical protein
MLSHEQPYNNVSLTAKKAYFPLISQLRPPAAGT